MTQTEFYAELAAGKRSWPATHVPGDLDVSGRVIHGDISFGELCLDGDFDLSCTTIHGSLDLTLVRIKGNLDLTGLKVMGKLKSCCSDDDPDLIHRYALTCVEGEILSDDLEVNGQPLTLPRFSVRVPFEDRELIDV